MRSLPTRERGLKLMSTLCLAMANQVAPYTGAWIEILVASATKQAKNMSLPTRERGLKYIKRKIALVKVQSRSLHGSVD